MIRAVVFDLDGTLLRQAIDFPAIRRDIGAPPGSDIIRFIEGLPHGRRAAAERVVADHERRAAECSELNEGALEVLEFVRRERLFSAVSTRNSRACLGMAVARHGLRFDCCVAREDARPKPDPEPLLIIARALAVDPPSLLSVGDFAFDTESALAAGAVAVFLSGGAPPLVATRTHFVVDSLGELVPLIEGLRSGALTVPDPRTLQARGSQDGA